MTIYERLLRDLVLASSIYLLIFVPEKWQVLASDKKRHISKKYLPSYCKTQMSFFFLQDCFHNLLSSILYWAPQKDDMYIE